MDENNNNNQKESINQNTADSHEQITDTAAKTVSAFDMPAENKTYAAPDNTQYTNYNSNTSYNTAPEETSLGFGIASLVLGILSIITSCCCGLGLITGILGIIFGCVQPQDYTGKKPGIAIAGIITSCVGILFSILTIIYMFLVGSLSEITMM
ncbi:MAG: DUF4190 domain-containing protein [Lachnospiraceae bacterium]|nr:DUF4190 domain-containing protein [Lachnospiraceae bacterium]